MSRRNDFLELCLEREFKKQAELREELRMALLDLNATTALYDEISTEYGADSENLYTVFMNALENNYTRLIRTADGTEGRDKESTIAATDDDVSVTPSYRSYQAFAKSPSVARYGGGGSRGTRVSKDPVAEEEITAQIAPHLPNQYELLTKFQAAMK
jgi:hypothetical protein